VITSLAASVRPPLNSILGPARGVAQHAARTQVFLPTGNHPRGHAIVIASANLAAAGNAGPFNVAGISGVLGSFLGLALLVIGLIALFRSVGQQAHRHVMSMAAVAVVGLIIAGVSLLGMTGDLAMEFAKVAVHK
jgi:hypothetical protein